jgi:hypothetical protein
VQAGNYIPSTPTGTTFGYVNIEYEYTLISLNKEAYWRFDWGDGTTTDWLQLAESETSITQSHSWGSAENYQVRIQFKNEVYKDGVYSNPLIVTIYSSHDNLPYEPYLVSGTIQGFLGETYVYAMSTTDPNNYQVRYRCDWGDGNLSDWTSLFSLENHGSIAYAWQNYGEYSIRIQAQNQYGLESTWSDPVHVTMNNVSYYGASNTIYLLVLNGYSHHIVFTSDEEGTFYNSSSGTSSELQGIGGGDYFIDEDSDGTWEYVYTPMTGSIEPYNEPVIPQNQEVFFLFTGIWLFLLIIVCIVVCIISVITILIKTGYIYIYDEVVVEK